MKPPLSTPVRRRVKCSPAPGLSQDMTADFLLPQYPADNNVKMDHD